MTRLCTRADTLDAAPAADAPDNEPLDLARKKDIREITVLCFCSKCRLQSRRQCLEKLQKTTIVSSDTTVPRLERSSLVSPSEAYVGEAATPRRSTANPCTKTPSRGAMATICSMTTVAHGPERPSVHHGLKIP